MIRNNPLEDNATNIDESSLICHDSNGAILYIIIVLLWYSIGIAFLLGMDMLTPSEEIEDSTRRRTRFLIRDLRDHTNTKEILGKINVIFNHFIFYCFLEELLNKQKRDRLWDIYLGTPLNTKDHLTHAESIRIRHIEKQLANIKRNHRLTHDLTHFSKTDTRYHRSRSELRPGASQLSSEETSTFRRQSSFDQQTIDRWKELSNLSKPYEQLPWAIRKLMIRKYFRRNPKKLPTSRPTWSQTTIPTTTNESTNLISLSNQFPRLSHGRTESDLSQTPSPINERQNPYISYFHIPSDHRTIFTPEFLL